MKKKFILIITSIMLIFTFILTGCAKTIIEPESSNIETTTEIQTTEKIIMTTATTTEEESVTIIEETIEEETSLIIEEQQEETVIEINDIEEPFIEQVIEEPIEEEPIIDQTEEFQTYEEEIIYDEPDQIYQEEEYYDDYSYGGSILTPEAGINYYNGILETYYNLPMGGVLDIMYTLGYSGEYWIREDGVKMFGPYVMVAADFGWMPRGSIVETSLGTGIVCDTGGGGWYWFDIAVTW